MPANPKTAARGATTSPSDEWRDALGYSYAEIRDMARLAVSTQYRRSFDWAGLHEQFDIATDGIIDALLGDTVLDRNDLIRAGRAELQRQHNAWRQTHGARTDGDNNGWRFVKFWTNPHPGVPEDVLIDNMAVHQVWAVLIPTHQDTLRTLAEADCHPRIAAERAGVTYGTFRHRVNRARAAFNKYWFEGENPPGMWHTTWHGDRQARSEWAKRRYADCDHHDGCGHYYAEETR